MVLKFLAYNCIILCLHIIELSLQLFDFGIFQVYDAKSTRPSSNFAQCFNNLLVAYSGLLGFPNSNWYCLCSSFLYLSNNNFV